MTARFFFGSPKQQRAAYWAQKDAELIERGRRMNEAFRRACEEIKATMERECAAFREDTRTDDQKDYDDTDSHYGWPED